MKKTRKILRLREGTFNITPQREIGHHKITIIYPNGDRVLLSGVYLIGCHHYGSKIQEFVKI